ncbi:MAG: NYN domain-containing protein [Planctomycetota bacterium]
MRVLVDGHNAIYALKLGAGDHAAQRRQLLALVASRAPDAVVYFDARNAPAGSAGNAREGGVRVEYCRGREADAAILDAVRHAERPEELRVVTNDREVRGSAAQLGARVSSVREFFGERKRDRAAAKPPPPADLPRFTPADFGLPDEVDLDDHDID